MEEPQHEVVSRPLSTLHSTDGGCTYTCCCAAGPSYTLEPELVPPQGTLRVVYHEPGAFVVVEKPAFLPSENTARIKDSVRARLESMSIAGDDHARVRLAHRLDWETSGLLVAALTPEAMRSLSEQFASRSMRKVYVADVLGRPPTRAGTVNLPLSPDPARLPRQRVDFGRSGKAARTEWVVEEEAANACRVRLVPESGRRHQLRMHCLALGCAIAGDSLYEGLANAVDGREVSDLSCRPSRLHLHAAEIGFAHPLTGEPLLFKSEPPFHLEHASRWGTAIAAAPEARSDEKARES